MIGDNRSIAPPHVWWRWCEQCFYRGSINNSYKQSCGLCVYQHFIMDLHVSQQLRLFIIKLQAALGFYISTQSRRLWMKSLVSEVKMQESAVMMWPWCKLQWLLTMKRNEEWSTDRGQQWSDSNFENDMADADAVTRWKAALISLEWSQLWITTNIHQHEEASWWSHWSYRLNLMWWRAQR